MEWLLLIALVVLVVWQVRLIRERVQSVRAQRAGSSPRATKKHRQLEQAQTGAKPSDPIEIDSPAVVEPQAISFECVVCGAQHRLLEHSALTVGQTRLRQAKIRCRNCGNQRNLYFRLRRAH